MMSLWDALRMNMMISYQELVRTFLNYKPVLKRFHWPITKNYNYRVLLVKNGEITPVYFPLLCENFCAKTVSSLILH